MRVSLLSTLATLLIAATPAVTMAAEEAGGGQSGLLTPQGGLMVWTLIIFVILFLVLSRFAFRPLTAAVAAREQALRDSLEAAKRDREEAARLLDEHRKRIEAARDEAQKVIAEGRQTADQVRAQLLEQARQEQHDMLDRARREIEMERDRAIAELRREAVDLALRGASKVIEKNLDDDTNRKIVESYLASIDIEGAKR